MTAGGKRRGPRSRRGWGETVPYLPPAPPPEGIDLIIEKVRIDDATIRANAELQMEEREARSDLVAFVDDVAELTRPERDHLGRVVVDWRDALVGAVVVAIVAALAFWVVVMFLTAPSPAP